MPSVLPGPGEQADLVERIRLGDPDAEAALVAMFHDRIRLMAVARTGDRELALEMAQDVMTDVVMALREGRAREQEKLAGFVYAIARHRIVDHYRERARRPVEQPFVVDPPAGPPADRLEDAERASLVRGALGTLNPVDRRILLMTLVDGLKPGGIARELALSDEVVRARKSRAIKKVKEYVERLSQS